MNPQRIMVLGDSHGNLPFIQQALQLAHKHDCQVVHVVGDFGVWTHVPAGVRFIDETDRMAGELGITVTFTDGNHENFDHLFALPIDDDGWRRLRPNLWHAPRGHIWRWGRINLMSMGGAHSIDGPGGPHWWTQGRGPLDKDETVNVRDENGFMETIVVSKGKDLGGWWPEETITDDDVERAITNMVEWASELNPYPEIDVLFAHDAPTSISLPFNSYPAGDENRARLQQVYEIAQPQLLVHGHFHMFQQFNDIRHNCLAVCLAHDASKKGGQYMFIDTDPFEIVVPKW